MYLVAKSAGHWNFSAPSHRLSVLSFSFASFAGRKFHEGQLWDTHCVEAQKKRSFEDFSEVTDWLKQAAESSLPPNAAQAEQSAKRSNFKQTFIKEANKEDLKKKKKNKRVKKFQDNES